MIVTGVLDALSGVDVVSAFRAMPATKGIPVALTTADTREEAVADGRPDSVPVIRKRTDFGDDLTDEDAFAAVAGRGEAILVGAPRPTAANWRLEDPAQVHELLSRLDHELRTEA